jgi:hypothetical protein
MPIVSRWREFFLFLASLSHAPVALTLRLAKPQRITSEGRHVRGASRTGGGESGFEVASKVLGVLQTD